MVAMTFVDTDPFDRLLNLLDAQGEPLLVATRARDSRMRREAYADSAQGRAAISRAARSADVWFGVNASRAGTTGQGADVTRVRALVADLDVKAGALASLDDAHAVVETLASWLGTPPAAVVMSGHGLQPYWPVVGGEDVPRAAALLRRWGVLVSRACAERGAEADNVFDVARLMRAPGTYNRKAEPVLVTATFADDWHALDLDGLDELLLDLGVPVAPVRTTGGSLVCSATDWTPAAGTCSWARGMARGWREDSITGSRHSWLTKSAVRLVAAGRHGCLSDPDAMVEELRAAFDARMASGGRGERTAPDPDEFVDALEWAVTVVEAMSDEQVHERLALHEHRAGPTVLSGDVAANDGRDLLDATAELAALRDIARARMVAPAALVGATIARVLAATEPSVVIPPMVGDIGSLNIGVSLYGSSGSGKSSVAALARDVIKGGPHVETTTPPSSGEGLAALFLPAKEGDEPRRRALTFVDELAQLDALQRRQSSTLAATLRSAISGQTLGSHAANPALQRNVPAHSYRWALVVGVQPATAHMLLSDSGAGTPQRFLWLPTRDPGADRMFRADVRPVVPGPPPNLVGPVEYPAHVVDEVRAAREAIIRGDADVDPLTGHAMLTRLKCAAALAIMHGGVEPSVGTLYRLVVDDAAWELSGVLAALSAATMAEAVDYGGLEARRKARHEGRLAAEHDAARNEAQAERVAAILARAAARRGELSRLDARRALGRDHAQLDEAVALAVERGWVVELRRPSRDKSGREAVVYTPGAKALPDRQ